MSVHESHNPYPLISYSDQGIQQRYPARVCSECNTNKVIPLRLLQFKEAQEEERARES